MYFLLCGSDDFYFRDFKKSSDESHLYFSFTFAEELNFCFPSYCTEFSKGIRKSVASQVLFLLNLPLKLKHFELKLEITDNVYQGVFGLSYFFFDGHMF